MKVAQLVIKLYKLGIKIQLAGEKLDIEAPDGVLTDNLINEISNNKNDIISFLKKQKNKNEQLLILNTEKKHYYSLSSAQRRLYVLYQLDKNSTAYNLTSTISLSGEFQMKKIEETFVELIRRHESFRTNFYFLNGNPIQIIHDNINFHLEEYRCSKEDFYNIYNQFSRPFDLSRDTLIRGAFIEIDETEKVLLIDMHHIISDNVSATILKKEFLSIYNCNKLTPLLLQYKDYSELQKNGVQQKRIKSQEEYWLSKFKDEIPFLTLPTDYTRAAIHSFEGTSLSFKIPENEAKSIKSFAEDNEVSSYMLLMSAFSLFISKISRQDDIIIGTPIAGRQHHSFENIVGVFINTLALRFKIDSNLDLIEYVKKSKTEILEDFDNQEYQFEDLVEKVIINRNPSRNPLFDVMFNFVDQTYISDNFLESSERFNFNTKTSKFDLTLIASEYKNYFLLTFEYSSRLFERETIERFASYFRTILQQYTNKLTNKISNIEIITTDQKQQILYEFNSNAGGYPNNKTVIQIFKEQVKKYPNNCALSFNDNSMNYHELDIASNKIANLLLKKGVREEDVIGLLTDRSFEVVVSILGILKVGCAYLPIDVDYPEDRISYMLENSDSKYLLTLSNHTEKCEEFENRIFIDSEEYTESSDADVSCFKNPNNLLYIIYTSGTTGRPKGVMIENKSVVNLFFNTDTKYDFNENDTWTMFHSHCFDFSVWEMYGSLLFGGKLVIIPKSVAIDTEAFLKLIKDKNVTILNQTPSAFYNLITKELDKPTKELKLRYVIFGGEALNPTRLSEWIKKYPDIILVNMFGITETTVHVTYKKIAEETISKGLSNIGRAIPGLSTFVLDTNQKLQPIGIPGELYVGGFGVARGYIKNIELTSERFIENPFKPGECLYRTGDIVKWLPDGDLEYLGRIDSQVQLRGFRIELREVEACFLALDQIKECVVVANANELNELYLSAYYVLKKSHLKTSLDEIKGLLSKKLPSYMIPSYFIMLDNLPLTSNGKIDRKALPVPQILRVEGLVNPTTSTQKMLVEIWKESLKLEEVSINDRFFNIGGDSIKAIRLVYSINKAFNIDLKIADLYLNESIEKLSLVIGNQKSNSNEERSAIEKNINELKANILDRNEDRDLIEDIYPMSDIEIGMAYHSILGKDGGTYHDQMVRQVRISNFNPLFFEKALNLLCDKHPILRTTLHLDDFQEPIQIVYRKGVVDYQHKDLTRLSDKEQKSYLIQELNDDKLKGIEIKKLPLWHTKSYAVGNDVIILLFMCHHAILDGWSDSSLMTELNNVYLKLIENDSYKPPLLQCTYKDHVVEQILEKKNKQTQEYWIQELKEYNRLEFSKDLSVVAEKKEMFVRIDEDVANAIVKLANEYGTNVKNVYFAAYIDIIRRFSYKNDFVVGVVSNTRPVCPDGDKLLGCFLNTVPVNIAIEPDVTIDNFLKYIFSKLNYLVSYDKLPLSEIQKLAGEDSSAKNPFFDTLFNYIDFHIFNDIEETKAVNYLGINGNVRINTLFDFSIDRSFKETSLLLLYTNNLITDKRAEEICNCFIATLKRFLYNPAERLGKDKAFSQEEKYELLVSFNNTENQNGFSNQISIILDKIFREYFNKTAIVVPVRVEDMHYKYGVSASNDEIIYDNYSYKYIDQRSNSLAKFLEKKGAVKNAIIGILLDPSVDMIISIVASLKLGATYMPISSEFPHDRIGYMLNDSGANILITDGAFNQDFTFDGEVVDIEVDSIFEEICEPLKKSISENDAAYVIYTSGTTGKPKGVIVSQGNLANYVNWFTEEMSITPDDKGILTSSFAFDLGYSSLFTSILNGAELHLPTKDLYLSSVQLVKYIDSNCISYLKLTPSHFNAIINSNELNRENTQSLRLILLGGEPINTLDVRKLFSLKSGIVVVNHYGPTETTIGCIAQTIKSDTIDNYSLQPVIGSPIHNAKAFIIDNDGGILPVGVLGELSISGTGVSLGYLNKPELTHSKFTHIEGVKGRVYQTGDKAKWLANGNIEFIGRIDNQLKIRGYRVELGEIESCIKKSGLVRDAVVVSKQNSNNEKYICAYIVKKESNNCSCSLEGVAEESRVAFSSLPDIIRKKAAENAEESFIINSNTLLNFNDVNTKVDAIANSIDSCFNNGYSLSYSERERYKRQILLDSWGLSSQEKLKATTVFVAGAGGGASPTLMQLALAGFGKIIVCDFDEVELSNLNRQFMHDESRIGMNKALSTKETLLKVNPNVEVVPIMEKLTRNNVMELVGDSAIIFDMFDGVQDKFILSECAVTKGIPHIISAMTDINAYSAIFHTPYTPCYHCVFDRDRLYALVDGMKRVDESYKKNPLAVVSSSLFVSTGLAVTESLKIVLGLGVPAYNKFFYYNSKGTDRISEMSTYRSMTYSFSDFFRETSKEQGFDWEIGWRGRYLEEIDIKKDVNCPVCGSTVAINKLVNTNDNHIRTDASKKFAPNIKSENNCVSIYLSDQVAISLSILGIINAGKSFCILDPNQIDDDLKDIVVTSGTRLIITDNNNFIRAEKLRNHVNRNIKIVNINAITDNAQIKSNQQKNNDLYYFYNDNNNEVKSIQLADWYANKHDSENNKGLIILKRIYIALLNNNKLEFEQDLFNKDDISSILNQKLLKHLPEYMLPAMYIDINSIPLTPNGKVNIKALPEPSQVLDVEIEKPQDENEKIILQVWQEVLGRDKISVTDNFFRIGGDSIKAIQISARLNKGGYKLDMSDLLRSATIRGVAGVIKKSTKTIDHSNYFSIQLTEKREYYPLSSAQTRLYLLQKIDSDSTAYNMPFIIQLESTFDKERLKDIFQQLIARHESFRTSFEFVDNLPVQLIHDDVDFEVNVTRVSKINVDQVRDSFIIPFNLSKAPLLRVSLVDVIDSNPLLMIDMHHIISDGTSHTILEREFNLLYNEQELKPIKLQCRDFSEWQNSSEQLDRVKGQEKYWLDRFTGELPVLSLTTDYQRPPIQGSEGATARFALSQDLTDGVKKMAKEQGLTLYMTLLGAYVILLSKLSGQEDVVVGTPIAGRLHADLDGIVGMFVNTLALRVGLTQDQRIKEYYKILKGYTLEAFENQEYQFEDLVDKLALNRDLSRNPLFDVMFNLLNQTDYGLISGPSLPNTILHEKGTSKFDLNLAVADFGNQLVFHLEYSTKLFRPERIDQFIEYFRRIVNQLIENKDDRISDVELINREEREELLQRVNGLNADYPREKGIHELFEEQVTKYSNRVALVVEGKEISYESLNNLSDQVASAIRTKGVDSGSIVAILSERSLEMVISIYGVLKAGCAYLPISLDYPQDRIKYMLQDSNCHLVLADESHQEVDAIELELLSIKACLSQNKVNQEKTKTLQEEAISHVLYTSGSTGRPKGVVIPHRVLVNSMVAMEKYYPVGLDGAYLLKTPYVFDVSTSELFGWFLGGGRLVISDPDAHKDPLALVHMVKSFGISHVNFVPSMLNIFLNYLEENGIFDLGQLKYIFAAGEELTTETVSRFNKLINGVNLVNIYGPTESFYVTHFSLGAINDCYRIPIGAEFSNISTFIVDKANHLQPVDIPGEICIGGDGLAIGYLNNPELTHTKFVENPFVEGEVYYRTGDLGLLKKDGNVEFLGRIDHQVKIRGFRIELGEIENTLRKHESIKECIVIVQGEGSEKSLCAYLVQEKVLSSEEIRTYLHNYLPDYMIPTYFITLDKLPLNSNGKVDRKVLPLPELSTNVEYQAPSNAIEERLAKLWSEVLGIPQGEISVNANFFSIGGHSLKATILVSKIQKEFDVLLPLREIFQSPTISAIATILFQMIEVENYVDRVEF